MNYDLIPIKFAYLLNVENCSLEDEMRSHAELLTENRRKRRRLSRKIKELNAKDKSHKVRKPEEQYRHDTVDQKIFTLEFTGKESHNMFREDLRTETLTRRNWCKLIKVKQNNTYLNLLDKYMLLAYNNLVDAK